MDEPRGYYEKWNKPITEEAKVARLHLYEVSKIVALIEAESRMVAAKRWEVGNYRVTNDRVWSFSYPTRVSSKYGEENGNPWTEEPGGLQSVGSQKSWTQLSDWIHTHNTHTSSQEPLNDTVPVRVRHDLPMVLHVVAWWDACLWLNLLVCCVWIRIWSLQETYWFKSGR